ncbi:serine/threonine-protein kinase [Microbulbifer thermotolerans]|uniref:serine/threonine-protein kinase n=1 Tax=Microbulbifer thermotolerans TaxID=252514 RepID=UPI00224BA186|nr:serine/threonine-protein kinase [Microbulbifer thermotolerans]MCX2835021.1 protein kinase [Microbulbifer thermotolerans]
MEIAESEQEQLGRYQIERTLGAGGMGIVYLARDTRLQRQVAIKKLRKDATSASAGARIQSEAQLLAKLNHPNIVQLYDVLEEPAGIALVMEYIDGTSLKEWMREHSAPLRDKLSLLMQICKGLTAAHKLGIIHRDLKPDNILITIDGTAKISDFGIAKSQNEDAQNITREDHVAGTVEAMSPEQLKGQPLDTRSDLFSLGTIAYELLCGRKPFDQGENGALALAHRIVNEPHIPPGHAWPGIPEPVAALLDRLLHKDPQQRPQSAQQVYEALDFLYQHQTDDTDTREFSATVTQLLRKPPSRRRRVLRALTGATGFVAMGIAGYFGWEYATRLDPQYIAVLPVEINGEVRGEENAKELTAAMVRQAMMNAASRLKASALVSFTPKEGQDFDAQLQALRDKGVTDALLARLECARVRCEIELQRIGPADGQIKQQASFVLLTDKKQESSYRVSNTATYLFSPNYIRHASTPELMGDEDYEVYLDIIARSEKRLISESDLKLLDNLLLRYPKNENLYRAYIKAVTSLYVSTNKSELIAMGVEALSKAKSQGIGERTILELELWLRTYDTNREAFDALLPQLLALDFPPAEIIAKYAKSLYIQGKYDSGIRYANKAAEINPSKSNLYLLALNYFGNGDYPNSKKILERIIQKYPEHWSSYGLLGAILIEMGEYPQALSAISKIPQESLSWHDHSNLGVANLLQKNYEAALVNYKNALEIAPDNLTTLANIAEIYTITNNKELQKNQYEKILQLTEGSSNIEAKIYRALSIAYLGNISDAITLIYKLNREYPEDTNVKYVSAQIYLLAREYRSASVYIDQLLDQGMSADWFSLPTFAQLCTQKETPRKITDKICR